LKKPEFKRLENLTLDIIGRFPPRWIFTCMLEPTVTTIRIKAYEEVVPNITEHFYTGQILDLCDNASMCLYHQLKEEFNVSVKKKRT
jgi:hypothetical protein